MKLIKKIALLSFVVALSACGKKVSGDFNGIWQDPTDTPHTLTIQSKEDHYVVQETGIPDIFSKNRKEKTYAVSEIDEFTAQSKDKGNTLAISPDKKSLKLQMKIPFVKVG